MDSALVYWVLINCLLCCAPQVAERLETAVNKALDDGYRTKDIWTEGHKLVGCKEMGEVLATSVA
jgi:3-isopropylmalate dehydrogenase